MPSKVVICFVADLRSDGMEMATMGVFGCRTRCPYGLNHGQWLGEWADVGEG